MPKSKRAQLSAELKRGLVERIHDSLDTYSHVFLFSYDNMRTHMFKDVRAALADSRFFLGKNRVMQKALGDTPEDEYRPALHQLANEMSGQVGLLFTNRLPADVLAWVSAYAQRDYARSGFIPEETITLEAGPLEEMPHTLNDTFRKLGMPVRLDRGTIVLTSRFDLCKAGEPLTPEQGRLLQLFGKQLAVFRFHVLAYWHDGKFTPVALDSHIASLRKGGEDADEDMEDDDGEEA